MRDGPLLRSFDIVIYKAKDANDLRRVPAAGATIDFYLQGATVREDVDLDPNAPPLPPVQVWHPGAIPAPASGSVQVDGAGTLYDVTGLDTSDIHNVTIGLVPTDGSFHHLTAGQRLIWQVNRPAVFFDPSQVAPPNGNSILTGADGRAACYLKPPRFDYIVTIGTEKTVFVDAEGSVVLL